MTQDSRKIVWVLGAGFSKFLGAPLLGELLTRNASQRVKAAYPDMVAGERTHDMSIVASVYEAGKKDGQWSHAEEFLERLDWALDSPTAGRVLDAWSRDATTRGLHGMPQTGTEALRNNARRMLAAECCLFLKDANPELERWAPYSVWVRTLNPEDAILTFNYDRVLEILAPMRSAGMSVPIPSELAAPRIGPLALKMHGSVDWILRDGVISRSARVGSGADSGTENDAALFCEPSEFALATPGPLKYRMTRAGGPLSPIWLSAEQQMLAATAVVFVGYRMPPTDASTTQWMIDVLRRRVDAIRSKAGVSGWCLPVHTVLGPNTQNEHCTRLAGLLQELDPAIEHRPWAMGAEDFLGLVPRDTLLTNTAFI